MVAGIQFYASGDDVELFLDQVGEGRTAAIWQWPLVALEPVSLSREEALAQRAVIVLSAELGPPVVLHRDDPALREGSVTAVVSTLNFQQFDPAEGVGASRPHGLGR